MNATKSKLLRNLSKSFGEQSRRRIYQIAKKLYYKLSTPEKRNVSYTALFDQAQIIWEKKIAQEALAQKQN